MQEVRLVQAATRARPLPFMGADADVYRQRRYRFGPQRLLDVRERAIVRRAVAMMGIPPESLRILDVPCGYGRLLAEVSPRARAMGADLSPVQARTARSHAPTAAGDLLAGLPFADRAFDAVMCVRLLHHFADPRDRVAAIRELTRVGGKFVLLSFYAPGGLWAWHRRAMERLAIRKPRIATVARDEVLQAARAAGFELRRSWRVLPGVHAHQVLLLARAAV